MTQPPIPSDDELQEYIDELSVADDCDDNGEPEE
jgi:hypothetical protein